ncbi:MAG TPA: CotH kinase family protein, partial [Tepidisphaeraceae bacterium]|nr:CotH kinase family protein [Tepidisphaeraceae bacterium]
DSPMNSAMRLGQVLGHRRVLRFNSRVVGVMVAMGLSLLLGAGEATTQPVPQNASQLFDVTKVWTIHLQFTADQWSAMEPKKTGQPSLWGPGGGRGPGMFVTPVIMIAGDTSRDDKLSKEEFHALGEKWFGEWDKEKAGRVSVNQLHAGLNTSLAAPGLAGLRPAGFNLQGQQGGRNGLASAMGLEFHYVHADVEFQGQLFKDVGIRYKGNGTWMDSSGSGKRSFKLQLDEFKKGQKLADITTLNLHNCITDASWMNEVLSHKLCRDAGVPAPRTAYARVYVTVPGKHERKYFGLYSIVENIDTDFAKERFGVKGGAIFKPVTPSPFSDLGAGWDNYKQTYDPKTKLSKGEKQRVIDFAQLVTYADDAEFAAKLPEFLDLDNFARFMAAEVYLSTLDSILCIGQNYCVYLHPKTRKFHFIPWDLDHSFGQFPMVGTQEQREQLSIHHPWRGEIRFLERVFKVEAFKKLYLARLEEFSGSIFKPERFHQQVDEIAAAIRPAVEAESSVKLRRLERVAAGKPANGPGIADALFGRGRGSFTNSPTPIKPFVTARSQSILDQLSGKSKGQTIPEFGFGAAPGGQGGPGGPGMFWAPMIMNSFDGNKDGQLTRDELLQGFDRWFDAWNRDQAKSLTREQVLEGINRVVGPPQPGPVGPASRPVRG